MGDEWLLDGAQRDTQSITKDWQFVGDDRIHGVMVQEITNVMTGYGRLTEIYRSEWDEAPVGQVFQSTLSANGLSAWHAHEHTLDRILANSGKLLIALFDAREDSPTHGRVNVFRVGEHRPTLLWIPPRVWHGVKNTGDTPASLINVVDQAYAYEHPDHWRVPEDTPDIPYDIVDAR